MMATQDHGAGYETAGPGAHDARPWPVWALVLAGLGIFAVAVASRIAMIDLAPIYDELYSMTPAQSYWREGTYVVLDGIYDRAWMFTRLIALSFEVFGEDSVRAARVIPSLVPGAVLVTLITLWTRSVAGTLAAGIVLVFLLLWPMGVQVSQYIRFYALQGCLFAIGALLLYWAAHSRMAVAPRIGIAVLTVPVFAVAMHLQIATVVGLAGIGVWVLIGLVPVWVRVQPWTWALVIAGAGAVAAVIVLFPEQLLDLWAKYRWAPWPWPANEDPTFYHRYMRDNYPTFWTLFPVAALAALAAAPRPALFCLAIFVPGIVLQSFGALKNSWYTYQLMPFFFVTWAIALAGILPAFVRLVQGFARAGMGALMPGWLARLVAPAVVGVTLLFTFASNAAFERAAGHIRGAPAETLLGQPRWDWSPARPLVEPWLAEGAVILTSEEMAAIDGIGDYDIAFNRPRYSEMVLEPPFIDFANDWRNGRPITGSLEAVGRIIACAPVGVFLADAAWLRGREEYILRMALMAQEAGAETVVDERAGMALFGWRGPGRTGTDCADIPFRHEGTTAAERLTR